ncbi:MAG TPA: hypothetical protein VM261_06290 [Kofleriaceae bacterium]|nr:hypothetical protein [Kofleriaceae bacterium]
MRTPLLLLTAFVGACQAKATPTAVEVVLRDKADATVLTLVRSATGCTAEPGGAITAGAGSASTSELSFGPGPAGPEIRNTTAAGGTVARVVSEDVPTRRLSIIDPIGVPMVRVTYAADGATVAEASRAVIGRIADEAGGLRYLDARDDSKGGVVTGAKDLPLVARLEIAAPLLVPADLPLPARALLACERLAAVTPSVK